MQKASVCIGLVAHVDAGKTTLSEALLYCSGARRSLGRVDHADAFLDTHTLEGNGESPSSQNKRCFPRHSWILPW